jgi:hypothetical protein
MPSISLLRRRDPWWEADGPAARRARRRERFVSGIAFTAALTAVGFATVAWAIELGVAAGFGVRVTLGIG